MLSTGFTHLRVCLSAEDWSCINSELFALAASKLDSIKHTLCDSHIALHSFEQ